MDKMPVIRLNGVTKAFKDTVVIRDLSFSISRGEIVGLLGPNGSGKTTTVRLINGVLAPSNGSIRVFEQDPMDESTDVRARTGVLTESAGLYGDMTAEQNLAFFARIYGVSKPESRIYELLRQFGLEEHRNQKVETFSTGMKKRLGIAKALIHQPEVLFLDEPTTSLDPEASRDLLGYIRELNKKDNVTVVLATHLLKEVQDLCHRFLFLHEGRLIETGTLRELADKYMQSFKVRVETDLILETSNYHGYRLDRMEPGFLTFLVETKEQIPMLLRRLLQDAPIYSAEILERDLETLYFNVRRRLL
ncbi:MAG: ABC transporter ATP-binding protein [Firmicutes bacterium]|nr:ABC transporter ATP-binding protein [Bacillota bacterium]